MHSMTGFGRGSHATEHVVVRIEASSVNRKQGEVVFFMPRDLAELEPLLRKHVLARISRGRVNVNVHLEHPATAAGGVRVDTGKARALEAAFQELSQVIDRTVQASGTDFLRAPDILLFEEDYEPEELWEAIEPALKEAIEGLLAMRADEGAHLQEEIDRLIGHLETITDEIEKHAPHVVASHRDNLFKRLREAGLDLDLDDERVLREIALYADRCDITEEITRLRSHFQKFRGYFIADNPVGRPMDFLCQEINREFNTIGSKANDASLAQAVVKAKTELEKVREQVQNIE